jgi:hypothetical protein
MSVVIEGSNYSMKLTVFDDQVTLLFPEIRKNYDKNMEGVLLNLGSLMFTIRTNEFNIKKDP